MLMIQHSFNKIHFAATKAQREEALQKGQGDIPDVRHYLNIDVQKCASYSDSAMKWDRTAIVWDSEDNEFRYRKEQFSQFQNGERARVVATENPMAHNVWINQQVYVDTDQKRLLLPNGYFIDGESGKMYTCNGVAMDTFTQANSAKEV